VSALKQIPRNALVWIVICLFAVMAPHIGRLPIWVLLVYVVAVVWRVMVYRGRWSYPNNWVKVAMTVTSFFGILASFGTVIGLEPTVALLLTAFALKLIELAHRKDAYVLLFLGYFICITEFLFSQDLLITLYSLLCVLLITTALVALHQPGEHRFNRGTIRLAGVMLLQAMPLMVVMFFLFPRFGPLWTVPIKSKSAISGMSDNMRPGDIASLSQSGEVAFRARFEGEIPSASELYWRGLVFSKFENGTWSSLGYYEVPLEERRAREMTPVGEPLVYSVILEPTQQNWLYSMRYARSSTPGVMHAPDYRLFSPNPVEAEIMYRIRSWPESLLDETLTEWQRKTETKLPPKGNARTRELARQMRSEAADDAEFVERVISLFRDQPFYYTLQPGTLTSLNAMDEFLFDTRRGFCEHYAAAFVTLMRAADVPARVVAGYQGGEVNPVNRTVIVHQFDAHAWAEVWLAGQGWVRVDPTAAVAPDRIEWGLERAVAQEGSFLADAPLTALKYRNVPLINRLRLEYDAMTYRWQSWVVGFNSEEQYDLLRRWLGEVSATKFAAVLIGSWLLVLVPVALSLLRRREVVVLREEDKLYRQFCDRLAAAGLQRAPGETPEQFGHRAAQALPAFADALIHITGLYTRLSYAPVGGDPAGSEEFSRAVRRFRL
jgi:transglutaminase-like putative cysteine protease